MKKQVAVWKQLVIVAVIFAVGGGLWYERRIIADTFGISLGNVEDKGTRKRRFDSKVPVIVAPVSLARHKVVITAVGTGRAQRSISVYPKTSGEIVRIHFRTGDHVNAGQPLIELDARQAKLAVRLTAAKLADANRALARAERLLGRGVTAEATADTARTAAETAQIEHEQAKETLADHTVRAPFSGVVGIPRVELGDRISETTVITTLDDREELLVEFEVPEAYLGRLKVGQPVSATNPGFRNRVFKGRLTAIDSRVDQTSRTVRVRANIDNREDLLRSGMSFTVTLDLDGPEFPSIPELALQWDRQGAYVWRISDGKAEKVAVQSIEREHGRVLVKGDLDESDLVVVEGVQRLRSGRPVEATMSTPSGADKASS